MDTRRPHEIKDYADIPEKVRKLYVPLTQEEAASLSEADADKRAAFMAMMSKFNMAKRRRDARGK